MRKKRSRKEKGSVRNYKISKCTGSSGYSAPLGMLTWEKFNSKEAETHPLGEIKRLRRENSFSDAQPQARQTQPNIEPPLHNIM